MNVGTGEDATIRKIAELLAEIVGYRGETDSDTSKPDGTPQKLLDVSTLEGLGWQLSIGLRDGLIRTLNRTHKEELRAS